MACLLSGLVNRSTMTEFHRAIETKDVNLLKEMLKDNPQLIPPTYRDLDILTIDYIAQFFIKYGYLMKELQELVHTYHSLIHYIPSELEGEEGMELLLHVMNLNLLVDEPLQFAVNTGDLRGFELLLKNGSQFKSDIFNFNNHYPILQHKLENQANSIAVEVLRLVLRYDTNINKTELLTSLAENKLFKSEVLIEMIKILFQAGANVNGEASDRDTPLLRALLTWWRRFDPAYNFDLLITCFIKEIARAKFENRKIIASDLSIIEGYPNFSEIFTKCNDQLDELKNTIFHPPYSFAHVLGMRDKNIKKLANLLKNEDFALNLEANLSSKNSDDLYYEDLNRIFKEAIIIRNKYNELELTLKSVMGKYIPTDVIILIIDYIKPPDLRLFA